MSGGQDVVACASENPVRAVAVGLAGVVARAARVAPGRGCGLGIGGDPDRVTRRCLRVAQGRGVAAQGRRSGAEGIAGAAQMFWDWRGDGAECVTGLAGPVLGIQPPEPVDRRRR
ncbi:MAG: hypothetical protein DLM56_13480 [Pseudonocardiales bacterium]|nr:MAG: hypothetical protein DLM56_13480 [Pseudonocardiales bacterium]